MNKLIRFLSFAVLAMLIQPGWAQDNFKMTDPLPVDPNVITGKLDNGITYYVRHNSEPKNRAELTVVINAGSVLEDEDQRGLAHMCEHMAFNGTKNFPKHALIEYLESIGMKFGADLNAYTSFDETVYMIEVPLDTTAYLDKGLQVLYDWACNVSYEGEEIDNERGVIHEEWRLGRGAQDRLTRATFPTILYKSKYAERLPIGDTAIFDHCPYDNLRRFYKDWYRPDLQAIIVVGDFDAQKVANQVKEMFSKIPKRTEEKERVYPEIPDHQETLVKVVTDKEAPSSVVEIFYKHDMKTVKTYADYKTSIAEQLFTGMLNQRLSEITMKPTTPFAYGMSVYTHFLGKKDAYITFAMAKNDKIKETVKTLLEENERVRQHGFTKTEFEREKKSFLKRMEKIYNEREKLNSKQFVNEYHQNFSITHAPIPGIEKEYELTKKLLPEITLDEVNKLVNEWITDKNLVVIVQAPERKDIKLPTEDDLKKLVKTVKTEKLDAYEDKTMNKPLITDKITSGKVEKKAKDKDLGSTIWTLSNGIKVVLKPTDFKDDEIKMKAYSWGGYSLYSLKDNFSARYCTDVMNECGLGDYNNVDLQKYLADKTANVNSYIGEQTEGLSGTSSVKDFETMLQLTYLYFTHPRYDKEAFEAYIERQKSMIENQSADPQSVWRDSIGAAMNQSSPYKKPLSIDNIGQIDFKRVNAIFRERFEDPASFTFFFDGNIDLKTAKPLIEKYLGGLPADKKNEKYKDLGIRFPNSTVEKPVVKGTDDKSLVYMIFPGTFTDNLENRIFIQAVADILTDKLLDEIREKEAITYSISANPMYKDFPVQEYGIGIFYSAAPANVPIVKNKIIEIIKKLQTEDITDDDLNKTIEKAKRKHEADMRKNRYWLSQLVWLDQMQTKPEFVTEFDNIIKKMNKESLKAAFNKYYNTGSYVNVWLKPEPKN